MENTSQDKRVETVKERLESDLVDDDGRPADPEQVASAVAAAAEPLADAPVQEFVPLLVEHDARDQLRKDGLHRDLDEADTGAAHAASDSGDQPSSLHLSEHQGLAMPGND